MIVSDGQIFPGDDRTPSEGGAIGPISDADIDRLFDRELDGGDRGELLRRIHANVERAREVEETARAIRDLREPMSVPDMASSVLSHVGMARGFRDRRRRVAVRRQRFAVAAGVIVALGGVAMLHRMSPQVKQMSPQAAPVAGIATAFRQDAENVRAALSDFAMAPAVDAMAAEGVSDAGLRTSIPLRSTFERPSIVTTASIDRVDEAMRAWMDERRALASTDGAEVVELSRRDGSRYAVVVRVAHASSDGVSGRGGAGEPLAEMRSAACGSLCSSVESLMAESERTRPSAVAAPVASPVVRPVPQQFLGLDRLGARPYDPYARTGSFRNR
ncbi:MAG: hypothetical protein CMJ31_11530 [Phycisphaerae bacterium]|nr:hypothetical protein [Phycisphaerae bacterium]